MLVDFDNDSVRTALDVARALGPRLWGVRLDTSGQLVDRALWEELGDFDPRGVNERLVRKVRDALDEDGFERVRIVASGGFTVEKIEAVRAQRRPVDAYGVGSSLIRGENDFTADIVWPTAARPRRSVAASGRTSGWSSSVTDGVRIVFETHSLTTDNEQGSPRGGSAERSPSAAGRSPPAGERRRADGIDVVYSSDLARAVETADRLRARPPSPIVLDWRLREIATAS